jgi:hypothetical protein
LLRRQDRNLNRRRVTARGLDLHAVWGLELLRFLCQSLPPLSIEGVRQSGSILARSPLPARFEGAGPLLGGFPTLNCGPPSPGTNAGRAYPPIPQTSSETHQFFHSLGPDLCDICPCVPQARPPIIATAKRRGSDLAAFELSTYFAIFCV